MVRNSNHRKILERELLRVGIKPTIETMNSGHLRISFSVAGRTRSIVTSTTPSDGRSTLNARAMLRRTLRGLYAEMEKTQ